MSHGTWESSLSGLRRQTLTYWLYTQYRASVITAEVSRLCEAFREHGIPVVTTKGVSLNSRVYGQDGTRWFGDADLMILPDDVPRAASLCDELGIRVGLFRESSQEIVPLSQHDKVVYLLSQDHMPRRAKRVEAPGFQGFSIDIAYSMTWARSEWQIRLDEIFTTREVMTTPQGPIPCLGIAAEYLFLVLHLFREAWFASTAKNIRLGQFRDLWALWDCMAQHDRSAFAELVGQWNLLAPATWVLGHADHLLNLNLIEQCGFPETQPSWLSTISLPGGRMGTDQDSMRERLLSHTVTS